MIETGVMASKEEIEEVRSLSAIVFAKQMLSSRFGPEAADMANERMYKRLHEIALGHGLQEIEGYYGLDAEGQFVKAA